MLIFEDVAYRELSFDGSSLPSLWSLGPDVVLQAGTFSKVFSPGFRMGWALGPAALVAPLADAKQNTDQCAGALGQRMVEEYGRAGHFDAGVPRAQALYASHWAALSASLSAHMPDGRRVERADRRHVHVAVRAGGDRRARRCAPRRPRRAWRTCPAARSTWATRATTRCACRSRACPSPTSRRRAAAWRA